MAKAVAQKNTKEKIDKEKANKEKALELAVAQIEKEYGQGSIMKLGENKVKMGVEGISTGILSLDIASGINGIPRGRIIEIYGPESSGKTTLTLNIIATVQALGGTAAFIDAEHALDPVYAKLLGVDINNLLVSQPDNGEQAMEIVETLVRSGAVDLIIVDSVAALVPKTEIDGEMKDNQMGLQARLMSKAMRKLTATISKSKTSTIFINQLREKIGVFFGNPEVTTGGRALKFYSSMRMEIRRVNVIKTGDQVTGTRVRVKIVKNKVAPPFKQAEFELTHGQGISKEGCALEAAVSSGIVDRAGTWYIYNETRLGQGRENAKVFLTENPKILKEIETKVKEQAGLK